MSSELVRRWYNERLVLDGLARSWECSRAWRMQRFMAVVLSGGEGRHVLRITRQSPFVGDDGEMRPVVAEGAIWFDDDFSVKCRFPVVGERDLDCTRYPPPLHVIFAGAGAWDDLPDIGPTRSEVAYMRNDPAAVTEPLFLDNAAKEGE